MADSGVNGGLLKKIRTLPTTDLNSRIGRLLITEILLGLAMLLEVSEDAPKRATRDDHEAAADGQWPQLTDEEVANANSETIATGNEPKGESLGEALAAQASNPDTAAPSGEPVSASDVAAPAPAPELATSSVETEAVPAPSSVESAPVAAPAAVEPEPVAAAPEPAPVAAEPTAAPLPSSVSE